MDKLPITLAKTTEGLANFSDGSTIENSDVQGASFWATFIGRASGLEDAFVFREIEVSTNFGLQVEVNVSQEIIIRDGSDLAFPDFLSPLTEVDVDVVSAVPSNEFDLIT